MNVSISRGLLAATIVVVTITSAQAQPVIYYWIATDDVADTHGDVVDHDDEVVER